MVANAALMDEMNADPIHCRAKLRELVDRLLLSAPVERRSPVFNQAPQLTTICSVCPSVLDLICPTRSRQAILKIVQHALRYVDCKRVDAHHFGPLGELLGEMRCQLHAGCRLSNRLRVTRRGSARCESRSQQQSNQTTFHYRLSSTCLERDCIARLRVRGFVRGVSS